MTETGCIVNRRSIPSVAAITMLVIETGTSPQPAIAELADLPPVALILALAKY